ncbi:unnamed protein product [Symbiodinium natans]|uniref:Uncharacterized protein n=1 Tax=Symbiodinium natans TaxID=878477 RepID=A0A812KGR3_9DINO|nr:unnamed protein product [Symbiodinium natans]
MDKASRVQPSLDYEVSSFDASLGRWVAVSGAQATGFESGDAVLARMAQASTRLRVQLLGLTRDPDRLLVELEVPTASLAPLPSELSVAISIPRLTWSVLNSGYALPPVQGPSSEEPFGDFSFYGVHIGVWQGSGQGLAVGARAESVGVEFYDMSTLSLVPLVLPEDSPRFTAPQVYFFADHFGWFYPTPALEDQAATDKPETP